MFALCTLVAMIALVAPGAEAGCKPGFYFGPFSDWNEVGSGDVKRLTCRYGCVISDRYASQALTSAWGGDGKWSTKAPCVISVQESGGPNNICSIRSGTTSSLGGIVQKTKGNCRVSCSSETDTEMRCCNDSSSKGCFFD